MVIVLAISIHEFPNDDSKELDSLKTHVLENLPAVVSSYVNDCYAGNSTNLIVKTSTAVIE